MIEGLEGVDFLSDDIQWNFHGLYNYVLTVERQIGSFLKEEEERLERTLSRDDPEKAGYLWSAHERLHGELIPRTFRYSCVVSLTTAIDATLASIARFVHGSTSLSFVFKSNAGRLYAQQWRYFHNVAGPLTRLPFMDKLDDLTTARNCMVHAVGNVRNYRYQKQAEGAVEGLPGSALSEEGMIDLAAEGVPPLIDEARKWLLDVWGAVFQHVNEAEEATRH